MNATVTSPMALGRLIVVDAPPPVADADVAIVRVRASSINHGELALVPARPDRWAPGQDVVGIIEEPAGRGGPPAGARVIGLADGGAWSELVAVPIDRLAPLPDAVPDAEAATLPVAGLTALRAVRALGDIMGRRILVTGASGSTGTFAVQLALMAGAAVTGLARTASSGTVQVVERLHDDDRFDGIVDTVGGDVLTVAMRHLFPNAKAVTFAGGKLASIGLESVGVPATLQFVFLYASPGRYDEDLELLSAFLADGRIVPKIARTMPFADVNYAFSALAAGGVDGKIVLVAR